MKRWIAVALAAGMMLGACGGDGDSGDDGGNGTTAPPAGAAQDQAAQSSLRNALATANVYFTDGDTYTGFDAAAAAGIEPGLTWIEGAEPGADEVAIVVADGADILVVTLSGSGTFFCGAGSAGASIEDAAIGSGSAFADVDTVEECTAAA